jgi:hypothetical protein
MGPVSGSLSDGRDAVEIVDIMTRKRGKERRAIVQDSVGTGPGIVRTVVPAAFPVFGVGGRPQGGQKSGHAPAHLTGTELGGRRSPFPRQAHIDNVGSGQPRLSLSQPCVPHSGPFSGTRMGFPNTDSTCTTES